jgi:hypothetical protein
LDHPVVSFEEFYQARLVADVKHYGILSLRSFSFETEVCEKKISSSLPKLGDLSDLKKAMPFLKHHAAEASYL